MIHGYKTIFPIPLGQAASWNPDLVEQGARIAAIEAASMGVNWSFAPMVDVTRDPRWGRIAESFGEDHLLNGLFGSAVVRGFQGDDLADPTTIAACVKHFSAYGWAEGGRDYNSAHIPENELFDIVLPPFKMCIEAGAASVMTAFNDINGIPATGHLFLNHEILRQQWGFDGVLLSDWESVVQMVDHGYTPNEKEAAYKAMTASLDMEMASTAYESYLQELIKEDRINERQIDDAVRRILRLKYDLGLFDNPYPFLSDFPSLLDSAHLEAAKQMAVESTVLLKNQETLPLDAQVRHIAVIGPLADAPHDQMGTWVFDGEKQHTVTPLQALREHAAENGMEIFYHRALPLSRSKEITDRQAIIGDVKKSDVVLLFLGEESILSGEAHSLANIDLQGAQEELVQLVAGEGKPVVGIIMAGRPVTFEKVEPLLDAVLYAWHPGTMGGPAIADLLFGKVSPSGKLPVTFPRHVGQIPIYYNHKNTGKPATYETWMHIDDIPEEAVQYSLGNTSHYLDYGFEPMYPFGFGLTYSSFELTNLALNKQQLATEDTIEVSVSLQNTGNREAAQVVQLYTRQLFGSRVRPVKELRDFRKVKLVPGQKQIITFQLHPNDLGFHNPEMEYITEPGEYLLWVGLDSRSGLETAFEIIE